MTRARIAPSLLLALSLQAAPLAAQDTQEDRDVGFIQGLIEDNLSSDGVIVRIEGFTGALSSRASVAELTIADTDGVWLRATGLLLDWNRSALLGGSVEVTEMSAETIEFVRGPVADTSLPAPEAQPYVFALPDLPVAINIEKIRADRIVLGEALLGTQYAFSVDGRVALAGGDGSADIVAQRLDATVGSFQVAGSYSNETRILALTLDLAEEANGIVARALDIPGRPSVRLQLDGQAPIDDYAARLTIATDGTERITGDFGLVTVRASEDAALAQDLRLDITGDVSALVDAEYADFFGTASHIAVQGGRGADGAVTLRALQIDTQSVHLAGSAEIAPDGWPQTLALEGRIASPDGTPVLLPGGGARTFIDELTLDIGFDAAAGDLWQGTFALAGLSHPAVTIPALRIDGSGVIVAATDAGPGQFTADVAYAADDLSFTDAAMAEAMGAALSGRIALARDGEGPVRIDTLTLNGPGLEIDASGVVQGVSDNFETTLSMDLTADDLTRFGALTGLDLGGRADLGIEATVRPLDGIFDTAITGQTDGLTLGIAQIDPLLAGRGALSLAAARDTAGTRLSELTVTTDEIAIDATADLTSTGIDAEFAAQVRDLGLALPGLDGAASVTGTAATGADGVTSIRANAQLQDTAATITAAIPRATEADPVPVATLDIQATISDLAPFSPLAGRQLGGALDLSLTGTAATDASVFNLALAGDSTDLALDIAQLDPFFAGPATVAAIVSRDAALTINAPVILLTTPTVSLSASAALTEGAGAANFSLDIADVAPALPDLSGALRLAGQISRDTAGAIAADLTGTGPGAAAIDLQATLTAARALDADVTLRIDDLAPYSAMAGEPLSGAVTLDASASAEDAYDTAATPFNIAFTLKPTDFSYGARNLPGYSEINGIADRAAGGALQVMANAALQGVSLAINGAMAPPAQNHALSGSLHLAGEDIAPAAAFAGFDLSGGLDLDLSGTALPDGTVFDVTFDLATDLAGFGYAMPGLHSARGTATREAGGAMTVRSTIDGYTAGVIHADGHADLVASIDGAMAADAAGNGLSGTIALRADRLADYAALVRSIAPDIALQDLSGAIDLTASGTARPDASLFDIAFDLGGADLAGMGYALPGALTAIGTATRDADGITAIDATATGPGGAAIDIAAAQTAAADGGQISGAIDIRAADLSPYSGLAGRSLAGSINADLRGTAWPDLSGFDLVFDASGADLSAGGVALPGGLAAQGHALRQSGGATSIDLDATGPGGAALRLVASGAETVDLDLTAEIGSLSVYAGLIGREIAGGVQAQVNGSTALDFSTFSLALDAQTRSLDIGVSAARPLLAGIGRITGQISRDGAGTLRATGLDVGFPAFSISGDFDSAGGAGGGTFAARLADIGQFTTTLSGPATAQGTARLLPGGGTSIDIDATGPGGISATVSGAIAAGGALDLALTGQVPLDLANPFLVPRTLDGEATFDLAVNGPPALSSVSGAITLANGRLFAPTVGQTVTGIAGTIRLAGGQANVQIGGGLDAGGTLAITGPVGLASPFVADIGITASGLVLRDPNLFETTADGQITLRGPLAGGAQIAGTIDIGETEIQVPSSSLSALGSLPEVRHLGAPSAVRTTLTRAGLSLSGSDIGSGDGGGGGRPFAIDLLIRAPNRIFIRGRGVDAELGGQLRITGTTAQLIPVGQFELVRGRVDILQQRFELNEGAAYLQGDFVPFIRLVARTETGEGTVVSVIVDGPADDPQVRFESQPELPQDEVLARLLFGRDLTSISPLQAVQLAAAVSTLAGNGGGGLIDDFRAGIGLDDLDIITGDDGGVAVRAGAYITENVYTDVVVGTDSTEITLNLDVTDDIKITGSAGSDGDTALGIYYERDY